MSENPNVAKVVKLSEVGDLSDYAGRVPLTETLAKLKKGEALELPLKRRSYIRRNFPDYAIKCTTRGTIVVYKA